MTLVRQLAAVAAWRRTERTINAVATRTTARPMTIQIQIGGELDPFAGAVALVLGWATGAGAAEVAGADEVTDGGGELTVAGGELTVAVDEVTVAGGELVLWAGEELAVRLETALLTLLPMLDPHAVARPAAQSIVTARSRFLTSSRIPGPFVSRRRQARDASALRSAWPVFLPAASPRTDE